MTPSRSDGLVSSIDHDGSRSRNRQRWRGGEGLLPQRRRVAFCLHDGSVDSGWRGPGIQAANGEVDPLFHDDSRRRAHGSNQSTAQIPSSMEDLHRPQHLHMPNQPMSMLPQSHDNEHA
ncbi:hypothetical protein ACLOJK_022184 [Asimina triloba]